MLGLTGHVLARRLALQTMSDSRPTESLIEEVAADAAAAYDDLESDADSMPDRPCQTLARLNH